MPKPPRNWPAGAIPKRMDREMAAYYCNLSPGSFDREVKAGTYPAAIEKGSRRVWDRADLDAALDAERLGADLVAADKAALDGAIANGKDRPSSQHPA